MNGVADYVKAMVASAWMGSFATRGKLKILKEVTAVVYPGVLSGEICQKLISYIDGIVETEGHPRVWRDSVGSDARILGFEQDIGDLIQNFELQDWIKAISAYMGLKVKSWTLMANRVVAKPGNIGSGGGLHRDSPFSHQVKCIWYLSDVNPQSGPFQYIPGSHVNTIQKRKDYALGQMRFPEVHDNLVEVCADAGSLLVCDTKCIHGGKPIEHGVRYAVTLYTFAKENGVNVLFQKSGIDPKLAAGYSAP